MYPNLYYAFEDLFGIKVKGLQLINSFGFFVAMAFLLGAWVLTKEIRRKEAESKFSYTERMIVAGKQVTTADILINFLLGFFLGYKIIGAFLIPEALDDPQAFILSWQGHLIAGLLTGALFGGLKWREKMKFAGSKEEKRTVRIWPHDRVGDMVIYAAIFGFLGAKIFHNLENLNELREDPIGSLISFSGLTIYGGLICATIAIIYYARKHKINVLHLADCFAPTMMIAYAIGRIGCHVSGDGDWGILNSSYISDAQGNAISASAEHFNLALQTHADFYIRQFGSLEAAHHTAMPAFAGLPNWLFAYTYPHNVISEGVRLASCEGKYCAYLPLPVFPTALYEVIMCTILFFALWALRKRIKIAGRLAAIYLILNGIERFLIEQIRVNTKYNFFGIHPTQAEIISLGLILAGVLLFIYAPKLAAKASKS
jgi:phosphatidylglycerol:prolipoprotein diacylglycerol transferase